MLRPDLKGNADVIQVWLRSVEKKKVAKVVEEQQQQQQQLCEEKKWPEL